MARLAISKGFLAEYVKLGQDLQRAVDQAIAAFARDSQPALHLEKPEHGPDHRIGILPVNGQWRGVVLTPVQASPEDTYSLVTVLPRDQVAAYVTNYLFNASRVLEASAREASAHEASPEEARAEEAAGQLQPSLRAVTAPGDPGLFFPGADEPSLSAGGLLTREADPEGAQPAVPQDPRAELGAPASGTTTEGVPGPALPEPTAPSDHVAVASEPGKVQRCLARSFAEWRTRRRSKRRTRRQ